MSKYVYIFILYIKIIKCYMFNIVNIGMVVFWREVMECCIFEVYSLCFCFII